MQCNGSAKHLGKSPPPFYQHEKLISSVALLAVCRHVSGTVGCDHLKLLKTFTNHYFEVNSLSPYALNQYTK
jgi:hypothetical protein